MLYLCGTLWLEESWARLNTIVMGTQTKEPAISYALEPPYQSRISASKQPAPPNDGVRNRVFFALGVLLTELCLNTTLSGLRSQTKEQLSDFELVDRLSDLIYPDDLSR